VEMVKLALGAMFFGTRVDERTSFALLDRFVAAGGTMVDTANSYAFWADPSGMGGQSEQIVGRWLARRGGIREQVRLATKVGAAPAGPVRWPANAEGLSAPAIKAATQASLGRLQTDRIDQYWTHMEDRWVPLEETAGTLADLAAAGTVGQLGCSNDYVQTHPELSLWAYTPLLRGAYVHAERLPEAYEHPGTTRRLAALDAVAAELGATRKPPATRSCWRGFPAATRR
jgi:aryl-alcohol dehydrogenase-like predicted oxidoreductase